MPSNRVILCESYRDIGRNTVLYKVLRLMRLGRYFIVGAELANLTLRDGCVGGCLPSVALGTMEIGNRLGILCGLVGEGRVFVSWGRKTKWTPRTCTVKRAKAQYTQNLCGAGVCTQSK